VSICIPEKREDRKYDSTPTKLLEAMELFFFLFLLRGCMKIIRGAE
jgi:hypothetical protein